MDPGRPTLTPPAVQPSPWRSIGARLGIALLLVAIIAATAYLDRSGYRDSADPDGPKLTMLDAVYYATVTVTTTGYGDIVPVTQTARAVNALIVTPARVLFLILLVGTTIELLAERTRAAFRERRWRSKLHDHIIVCGYGTKGRTAVETLLAKGVRAERIVVVDPQAQALEQGTRSGLATIAGDATKKEVLEAAEVRDADTVIVAADRDDAAVLITLSARELNASATIVSAVREEDNVHLLQQSGADSVITTSGSAGRLLGLATQSPGVVDVLEDLLAVGRGLDIVERTPAEHRELLAGQDGPAREPVIAIVRGEEVLRFDDARAEQLRDGDRLVCLASTDGA